MYRQHRLRDNIFLHIIKENSEKYLCAFEFLSVCLNVLLCIFIADGMFAKSVTQIHNIKLKFKSVIKPNPIL